MDGGGYVKQYEVAINPDRLASFGLTVVDLYKAIEGNNENTGGSYIEQGNNLVFYPWYRTGAHIG